MASILDKIVAHKVTEIAAAKLRCPLPVMRRRAFDQPPPRNFLAALQNRSGVSLIAEVKQASPSQGIIRQDFDPVLIARIYKEAGAHCISVLTEEAFFLGHLDFLTAIRAAVDLPLLRKDFILDTYQVFESRAAGADAVLLIAECLDPHLLIELHQLIEQLKMTALVELYDPANLKSVLACQPKLIGVNNRDLNTFAVDLQHSIRLKQQLPPGIAMVSESGIATAADVATLRDSGIEAMLVGESLMRADDIALAVKRLLS